MTENGTHEKDVLLVYTGLRLDANGKKKRVWMDVTDVDLSRPIIIGAPAEKQPPPVDGQEIETMEPNRSLWFTSQLHKGALPGVMIKARAEIGPDGTRAILGEGREYHGKWPNRRDRAYWRARDQATRQTFADNAKIAREMREDVLRERLEPIRAAYFSMNHRRRTVLLALVIEFITRGGVK